MTILPTSSSVTRIEKAKESFLSLLGESDIDLIIDVFQKLNREIRTNEKQSIKNNNLIEQLWFKAIELNSPLFLNHLIQHRWTPLLRINYKNLAIEKPLSWGWIALHKKSNLCFEYLMRNKDIQDFFLKDAQITSIIDTLLWNNFSAQDFDLPAKLTSVFHQQLFNGNSMLHLITKNRLWGNLMDEVDTQDNEVSLTWIKWVEKYMLDFLDEKNIKGITAFDSDNIEEQEYLKTILAHFEKIRFSRKLENTEKSPSVKLKRI